MSIDENLDPRDERYVALIHGRGADQSDEEIAANLGSDSPRKLYRQLAEDGFPVCGCGVIRPGPDHTCEVWEELERQRHELYTGGAMVSRLQILQCLGDRWLAELQRVSIPADGWKEPDEWTLPPENRRGIEHIPITLDNGQQVVLSVGAFPDDPRGDGREFLRTEVRHVTPRTRQAIIAAVAVMEGVELPKKLEQRHEALEGLRKYLQAERDTRLDSEEYVGQSAGMDRMEAFVKVLLWHFRSGVDSKTDEEIDLMAGTADRVAKVVEAVRQLADYLEFGDPNKDTRRQITDAQRDMYACELRNFADLTWPKVAARLGFDTRQDECRNSAMRAQTAASRGEQLFLRVLDSETWEQVKRWQKDYYRST